MDKLDLILEKLDKMQGDITALKSDNKLINSKLDSLTEITYTIMENQTEHKMRIEALENKAVKK